MDPRILNRLNELRGRLRSLVAGNGALWTAGAFLSLLLLAVGLDWWLRLPGFVRLVFLAGTLGATGYAAWKYLLAPLLVPFTVDDMALAVERRYPGLGDRLISAVQLSRTAEEDGGRQEEQPAERQRGGAPSATNSPALVEALTRQTEDMVRRLQFDDVFLLTGLRQRLMAVGALASTFVVLTLFAPGFLSIGLPRLFAPFGEARWPYRTQYVIVDPVTKITRGEDLVVRVRVDRRRSSVVPRTARIQFRADDDHPWMTEAMTNTSTGAETTFETRFPMLAEDLQYRITAGDQTKPPVEVEVIPPTDLREMTLTTEYPEYMNRPTTAEPAAGGNIVAIKRTRVTLEGTANRPLAEAWVLYPGERDAMEVSEDGRQVRYTFPMSRTTRFRLLLVDTEGFRNRADHDWHFVVKDDEPPELKVASPSGRRMEKLPVALVRLDAQAEDDIGVADVSVAYHVQRGDPEAEPATQARRELFAERLDAAGTRVRAQQKWDLLKLKDRQGEAMTLQPGDELVFHLAARDHRPPALGGPGEGRSQTYTVAIISEEELARKYDQQKLDLRRHLKSIIRLQEETHGRTADIRDQLAGIERFGRGDERRVRAAEHDQRTAAGKSRELAGLAERLRQDMADNRWPATDDLEHLRKVTEVLREEAGGNMPLAATFLLKAVKAAEAPERQDALASATSRQRRSLETLHRLLKDLEKWEQTEELLRLARRLLQRQEKAGESTRKAGRTIPHSARFASLGEEMQKTLTDLSREQRAAAGDMRQLEDKMAQAWQKLSAVDKALADKVGKALRIARDIDVDPSQPATQAAQPEVTNPWLEGLSGQSQVEPSVEAQMVAAAKNIKANRLSLAHTHQGRAEKGLRRLIDVLEHRSDVDYEKLAKDIARMRKEARQLREQERQNAAGTRELAEKLARREAIDAARRKLADAERKQKELRRQLDSLNRPDQDIDKLDKQLEQAENALRALIRDQQALRDRVAGDLPPAERELAGRLDRVRRLQQQQNTLLARTREATSPFTRAVTQGVKHLEDLQGAQHQVKTAIDQAASVGGVRGSEDAQKLQDRQAPLPQQSRRLAEALREAAASAEDTRVPAGYISTVQRAATAVSGAADSAEAARQALAEGVPIDATEHAQKMLDACERAAGLLERLAQELKLESGEVFRELAEAQNELAQEAGELAFALSQTPGDGEALAEARKAMTQAGKAMAEAATQMVQGGSAEAQQNTAAGALPRVRASLEDLAGEAARGRAAQPDERAAEQEALQERAVKLARQLDEAGRKLEQDGAAAAVQRAADAMRSAGQEMRTPRPAAAVAQQDAALAALREAAGQQAGLRTALEERRDRRRHLARQQKELQKEVDALTKGLEASLRKAAQGDGKQLDRASNAMGQSGQALDKAARRHDAGQTSRAAQNQAGQAQDEAIDALQKAQAGLEKLAEAEQLPSAAKLRRKARDYARRQDRIRAKTDQLGRDIDQAEQKMPSADGREARSKAAGASRSMRSAADAQSQGRPQNAEADQKQAEQQLAETEKALERMQQEAEKRAREQAVAKLEEALQEMLETQQDVRRMTAKLDRSRNARQDPSLSRLEKRELSALARKQGGLAERARQILQRVQPHPVYQYGISTVRGDFENIKSLLDFEMTGDEPQNLQQQAIAQLQDMIEALKQQKKQQQQQGGGGGGQQGGQEPLVKMVAQLKLLRRMQQRLNDETVRLHEALGEAGANGLTEHHRERLHDLARREGIIGRLTRALVEEAQQQMGQ